MNATSQDNRQHQQEEAKEERARCEWDFQLSTVVSPTTTSDSVGAAEFDPSRLLLATAGISRKIRIYPLHSLLPPNPVQPLNPVRFATHHDACDFFICAPAKLSSIRWREGGLIAAGDYDGVVTEYDLERREPVFERDEHAGRRVWSLDYSRWLPCLGASGSDDGTAQLWDPRVPSPASAGEVRVGSAVCCVGFDPAGGPALAVGSADRRARVYDVRAVGAGPVTVMDGHVRTVTYVRLLGDGRAVTSATDGTHQMWEVENGQVRRAYRGHENARSFVGLSVWREGGLIGCGSESNEVFVYDLRWGEPVWVRAFEVETAGRGGGRGFVSAVCWREGEHVDECALVAGGSDGVLQVFTGKRKQLL